MEIDAANVGRHKHSPHIQKVCCCLALHLFRNCPASFELDNSPCARTIWISTTCLILRRWKSPYHRHQQKSLSVCCANEPCGYSLTGLTVLTSITSSDFHSWEDHFSTAFHSEEFDEQASVTSLPVLDCCSVHELRCNRLSDLVFSGLLDTLGLSDNENLFTALISITRTMSSKITRQEWTKCSSLFFTSLTVYHEFSTFVRWLYSVDFAWFVGLVNNSSSEVPEDHRSPRSQLSTCLLDTVTA